MCAASAQSSNPFPPGDRERRSLWDMLVKRDFCFVSGRRLWSPHGAPTSLGRRAFAASILTASADPGRWKIAFPTVESYRDEWLRQAARPVQKRYEFPGSPDKLDFLYASSRLDRIEIVGERALAHKKFDGAATTRDGQEVVLRFQSIFHLAWIEGRWKIAGFVGYLPNLRCTQRQHDALKTLRWGIIGLGWFGEIHAETLSTMPGIELAALCTRRPQRLGEMADRFAVTRRYTNYRELLADPDLDVVSIVTHVNDHRDIAIDALGSGKHVLLEKPMAPTAADCDQILQAARAARGFFIVGHVCRFDPRVLLAKQAIDEGRIGKIISMHARRVILPKRIGRTVLDEISALMGDGIHDGDLMLWFSGAKPVTVYAQEVHPGDNKYADGGWALARLDSGAVAVIESIWHLPENTRFQIDARMEVIGTAGALYINCGEAGLEIQDGTGNHMPDTVYWPALCGQRMGALRAEFRYFADCVSAGRRPDRITPDESRAAVALLRAARCRISSRTGRVIEF